MQSTSGYLAATTESIQKALAQMPIRSSAMARRILSQSSSSLPENKAEIERYVQRLLGAEHAPEDEMNQLSPIKGEAYENQD